MKGDTTKSELEKAKDAAGEVAHKAKDQSKDTIDDVMNYFTKQGIKFENSKTLEKIEFAAHEGRTFDINGKRAYLYRVNTEDEHMQKVLSEAKEKKQIKVNVDNKEQMYPALVNGGYLLLYDGSANMSDVVTVFSKYANKN